MTTRLIVSDRIYIPEEKADHEKIESLFLRSVYDEDKCKYCEYLPDRHSEMCDNCPSYGGTFKLHTEKEIDGKQYIGIPVGARKYVPKVVHDSKIKVKDLRSTKRMKHDIRFIAEERDYQKKARRDMIEKGYGILKAPPRSGKTVMATAIICKIGYKTLITAAQQDWLDNFYETICGNPDKDVEPMTNAPEIEKFEGKKIVGFCKSYEDFKKYDICLATYQTFISSKGQKLLKKIKRLFGTIVCDEVHDAGAPWLSRVLNSFEAKHRFGLTGTDDRKDCFVAGTLVDTPEGNVPIENLNVGDKVYSFNFSTNEKVSAEIAETHVRQPKTRLMKITFGDQSVVCTEDHEFWCDNRQTFVKARELTTEDVFLVGI